MQQNMGCFVDQRLDHGRVVHVGPDEHPLARPVGLTVGPLQMAGVGDGVDRESLRLDQLLDCGTEPPGSLAGEQAGSGRFGEALSRRLAGIEDGGDAEASNDRRSRLGLTDTRLVPSAQRPHIALAITSQPACRSHGSQDGIPVLSTLDAASEGPPRLESCDIRRRRLGNSTFLVRSRMLSEDQHHVVGRVVVQPGLEIEELSPIFPGDQGGHLGWPAPLAPRPPSPRPARDTALSSAFPSSGLSGDFVVPSVRR